MAVIFTYLAQTFFFWRNGRKSNPSEEHDQKPNSALNMKMKLHMHGCPILQRN